MVSPQDNAQGDTVVKLMSITRQEFETSLARLNGAPARQAAPGCYEVTTDDATPALVLAEFEELPNAVLGGLMALPRARVTLRLQPLSDHARMEFLNRFDKTFQRGGG